MSQASLPPCHSQGGYLHTPLQLMSEDDACCCSRVSSCKQKGQFLLPCSSHCPATSVLILAQNETHWEPTAVSRSPAACTPLEPQPAPSHRHTGLPRCYCGRPRPFHCSALYRWPGGAPLRWTLLRLQTTGQSHSCSCSSLAELGIL